MWPDSPPFQMAGAPWMLIVQSIEPRAAALITVSGLFLCGSLAPLHFAAGLQSICARGVRNSCKTLRRRMKKGFPHTRRGSPLECSRRTPMNVPANRVRVVGGQIPGSRPPLCTSAELRAAAYFDQSLVSFVDPPSAPPLSIPRCGIAWKNPAGPRTLHTSTPAMGEHAILVEVAVREILASIAKFQLTAFRCAVTLIPQIYRRSDHHSLDQIWMCLFGPRASLL